MIDVKGKWGVFQSPYGGSRVKRLISMTDKSTLAEGGRNGKGDRIMGLPVAIFDTEQSAMAACEEAIAISDFYRREIESAQSALKKARDAQHEAVDHFWRKYN